MKNNAAIEEPTPVQTVHSEIVLPYLMLSLLDSGREYLAKDLQDRAKLGYDRYGTYLMSFNGRNCLLDLYQELLDALIYLRQYELEKEELTEEFDSLKRLTISIKKRLTDNGS